MTDIVARIDEAIGCQQCGKKLREGGPSSDFCGESCQGAWYAARAEKTWPASDSFARAPGQAWGASIPGWTAPLAGWLAPLAPGDVVTVEIGNSLSFQAVVSESAPPDGFALVQLDNTEAVYTPAEPPNESGWLPRWMRRHR